MTSTDALDEIERYHDEEVYDVGETYIENIFEKEIKIIRDDLEKLKKYIKKSSISWDGVLRHLNNLEKRQTKMNIRK